MTTTTYLLPHLLGGGKLDARRHRDDDGVKSAGFYVDGELVWVPLTLLMEVAPPLSEPPPKAVVLVGDDPGLVYRRYGAGWAEPGGGDLLRWADVCALGAPVRLVPDPLAEPLQHRPWQHRDADGCEMGVYESQRPWAAARVGQGSYCADLTPEACLAMARALVAAWRGGSNVD